MAYNSRFTLTVQLLIGDKIAKLEDENPLVSIIEELRDKNPEACLCLDNRGESSERGSWYKCEEEIAYFSQKYPYILFTIHREGETSGDIENLYILNGKVQKAVATLQIAPVNIRKLLE